MPKGNLRPILKPQTRILSLPQSEACAGNYREKDNQMSSPKVEDKEPDRPRIKHSRRKPFICRVAVFDENEDPNKKSMYPKHLVYAGGKDTQLEEIRAMHYWNKVKGVGKNFNKTFRDMSTQTEPEPTKVIPVTETCTQTESTTSSAKEIAIQTEPIELNEPPNHNSAKAVPSRITTRSSARAKAASKLPTATATSVAKSTIKEEPAALNSVTFIVPKKQATTNSKKLVQVEIAQKLPAGEHLDNAEEDDDLTLNTKAFKVLPSSTPFQVPKNKNKGRRKTMKVETP